MVSPVEKNGLSVRAWARRDATSERVALVSKATAPDAESGGSTPMLSTRDPIAGWVANPIAPPLPPETGYEFQGFSGDLGWGILLAPASLATPASPAGQNLYRRNSDTGAYEVLTPLGADFGQFQYFGASSDFSAIAYEASNAPQTSDAVPGSVYPYVWREGAVSLAGILPDGTPAPNGAQPGAGTVGFSTFERAFSRDGDRVVFHAVQADSPDPQSSTAGQLYVRTDDGTQPPTTAHVSASQRTPPDPAGPLPALFWSAEADHGSKVLFTSCEKLTDDSTASFTPDDPNTDVDESQQCANSVQTIGSNDRLLGRDLYVFDVDSGDLTDLTTGDASGADVYGVVGVSDDLDSVYFVAAGDLAAGATSGQANLYLWRAGAVRFIATLDASSSSIFLGRRKSEGSNWTLASDAGESRIWSSRVSADGSAAVFSSRLPLTGQERTNAGACPSWVSSLGPDGVTPSPDDVVSNPENRCMQVFRYDADADALTCVSCGPPSDPAQADTSLYGAGPAAPPSPDALPGNLSPDGERVYFESRDRLVPDDVNTARDVYEWQAGEVSLISSGKDSFDSFFGDATPSGIRRVLHDPGAARRQGRRRQRGPLRRATRRRVPGTASAAASLRGRGVQGPSAVASGPSPARQHHVPGQGERAGHDAEEGEEEVQAWIRPKEGSGQGPVRQEEEQAAQARLQAAAGAVEEGESMRADNTKQAAGRRTRRLLMAVTAAVAAALLTPAAGNAAFEISRFEGLSANQDGTSALQAGSHPYSFTTSFEESRLDPGSGLTKT